MTLRRYLAGRSLLALCTVVDSIPWHDGRWYLRGHRGCHWGISAQGFALLDEPAEDRLNRYIHESDW